MSSPTVVAWTGAIVVTATNGATFTPTISNGAIGDLLILCIWRADAQATPNLSASGWTNISGGTNVDSTNTQSVATYWKRATSATGSTDQIAVTFGTSTVVRGGMVVRLRGADNFAPIHNATCLPVAATATTVGSTNFTATPAETLGVFIAAVGGRRASSNTTTNWPDGAGVTTFSSDYDTTGTDMTIGFGAKQFDAASSDYLTPAITWSGNTTTGPGFGILLSITTGTRSCTALPTTAALKEIDQPRTATPVTAAFKKFNSVQTSTPVTAALESSVVAARGRLSWLAFEVPAAAAPITRTATPVTASLGAGATTNTRTATPITTALAVQRRARLSWLAFEVPTASAPYRTATPVTVALSSRPTRTAAPVSAVLSGTSVSNITSPLVLGSNSHFFTDCTGKAILLAGSHTWNNFQDWAEDTYPPPAFDFDAYVTFLKSHGHNCTILWRHDLNWNWTAQGSEWPIGQWPWSRTGPGTASDGRACFDLDTFNQSYFDRLYDCVYALWQNDIYAVIQLFGGEDVMVMRGTHDAYPFSSGNNINSIADDGSASSMTMGSANAISDYEDAYVQKVLDTLGDLPNVIYEIDEEGPGAGWTWWRPHLIDLIHTYETANTTYQHPVGAACDASFNDATLYASDADVVFPYARVAPTSNAGNKVILNDGDHSYFNMWNDSEQENRNAIWENVCNGSSYLFMDPYITYLSPTAQPGRNLCSNPTDGVCDGVDTRWDNFRDNLGYVVDFSNRIRDLLNMTPQPSLASTTYCLAKATSTGSEMLVYLPSGGSVNVNLSHTTQVLRVEWFQTSDGTNSITSVTGGSTTLLTSPFGSNDAVLYILDAIGSRTATPVSAALSGGSTRTATPITAALTKLGIPQIGTPITAALSKVGSRTATPVSAALQSGGTRAATPVTGALAGTFSRRAVPVSVALSGGNSRSASPVTVALQALGTRLATPVSAALSSTLTRTATPITASLNWLRTSTATPIVAVLNKPNQPRTATPVTAALTGGLAVARTATPVVAALRATLNRSATPVTASLNALNQVRVATPVTGALSKLDQLRIATPVTAALGALNQVRSALPITAALQTQVTSVSTPVTTVLVELDQPRTATPVTCALSGGGQSRQATPVTASLRATESTIATPVTTALTALNQSRTAKPVTASLYYVRTRTATPVTTALSGAAVRWATPVSVALRGTEACTATPVTAALSTTVVRTAKPVSASTTNVRIKVATPVTAAILAGGQCVATPVTAALFLRTMTVATPVTASLQRLILEQAHFFTAPSRLRSFAAGTRPRSFTAGPRPRTFRPEAPR